ncbi:unnamed protein product [Cunninghamella blakesleeana]
MKYKFITITLFLLFIIDALAKGGGGGGRGGGGGGGGGRGGGSSGGGSSGGSKGGGSSGGSSGGGRGAPPSGARPGGSVSSGGGRGNFPSKPSYTNSGSRQNFNNYRPTYAGPYAGGGYGYVGHFNPALGYFFIIPSALYLGYYAGYHRYHHTDGAYYAPQITNQGSGSSNVLINGTAYPDDNDNYHYTFNVTARSDQFATIDLAYFDSSDYNANPADFIYRLTMAHVLEFDDSNNNGFYDANERILSISSLQNINWQPMILNNRTVANNVSQTYLETTTFANVTYNNTAGTNQPNANTTFGITMTIRSTNLQLNGTASIPLQPNSIQYDIQLQNFPSITAGTLGTVNPRTALAQIVSTRPFTNVVMDVNTTTPLNIALQTKTNVTYGASVGNFSEGRLEYQPSVNITNMQGVSTSTWTNLLDPSQVNRLNAPNDWAWGSANGVDNRQNTMLLVTLNNNTQMSGLAFVDTDVISSAINDAGGSITYPTSFATKLMVNGLTGMSLLLLLVL